jgi:hypothetical protein
MLGIEVARRPSSTAKRDHRTVEKLEGYRRDYEQIVRRDLRRPVSLLSTLLGLRGQASSHHHLTCLDGLPTANKVAPRVRIHPAPPASLQFRDSLILCVKNAHLVGIRHSGPPENWSRRGSDASFGGFSPFALWAVDLACSWASAGRLLTLGVLRPAAQIRGLAFAPPSTLEYQNDRSVVLAQSVQAVDGLPQSAPPSRVRETPDVSAG